MGEGARGGKCLLIYQSPACSTDLLTICCVGHHRRARASEGVG